MKKQHRCQKPDSKAHKKDGERLRRIRKKAGKSQTEFAKELDISPGSVANYEKAKTEMPPSVWRTVSVKYGANPVPLDPDTDPVLVLRAMDKDRTKATVEPPERLGILYRKLYFGFPLSRSIWLQRKSNFETHLVRLLASIKRMDNRRRIIKNGWPAFQASIYSKRALKRREFTDTLFIASAFLANLSLHTIKSDWPIRILLGDVETLCRVSFVFVVLLLPVETFKIMQLAKWVKNNKSIAV